MYGYVIYISCHNNAKESSLLCYLPITEGEFTDSLLSQGY